MAAKPEMGSLRSLMKTANSRFDPATTKIHGALHTAVNQESVDLGRKNVAINLRGIS